MRNLLRFLLLYMFVCAVNIPAVYAKDTTTILLFGDSIIAGYGLKAKDALPSQLERVLQEEGTKVSVINGGVSGDTTAAGRNRLAWTLDKYKPDLVFLALGGNDVLRGITPNITRENLDAMLSELKKRHIPVILSAVEAPANLGIEYHSAFKKIYEGLADKYDAPLYPFLLHKTFGKPTLMQLDGIHPNEVGAKLIAKDLAQYLMKNYSLSR